MTERSVAHASFTIERRFEFKPATVFKAFKDPAVRRRWFVEGDDPAWQVKSCDLRFDVGAHESSSFTYNDGPIIRNDTFYFDIVDNERIVFGYSMANPDGPFSASLSTITLKAVGAGTLLTYTEQAAFFEDADGAQMREQGCRELFEKLNAELEREHSI